MKMILLIAGISFMPEVFGQNINFIHYDQAMEMYNPAVLSGTDKSQVFLNYRNSRLTDDISSYSALFGLQVPLANYTGSMNLGTVGLAGFDDRSDYALYIRNSGVAISYSQPVKLSARSMLSIGLQCNVYQKRLDLSSYTTGSQWNDDLGFDPLIGNGEEQFRERFSRYILNSGVYWQANNTDGQPKAFAGISLFNINRPEESFTGNGDKRKWRYFVHAGYVLVNNEIGKITADGTWLLQNGQNTPGLGVKAGMYYGTQNSGIGEISFRTRYLANNTLMFGAEIRQSLLTVGLSYDFATSQSFSGSRSNAFELYAKVSFGRSGKKKSPAPSAPSTYVPGQKRVFAEERKNEVIESSVPDSAALKKVEMISDTTGQHYEPLRIALKRDFKFSFNDAVLNDDSKAYLDEMVVLMSRNKNITLEIVGHTDDVGSKEANMNISLKRARIVADYLLSKGIDKRRITLTGKMDSEPLFPNNSPANRAKNRRVEFIIMN